MLKTTAQRDGANAPSEREILQRRIRHQRRVLRQLNEAIIHRNLLLANRELSLSSIRTRLIQHIAESVEARFPFVGGRVGAFIRTMI